MVTGNNVRDNEASGISSLGNTFGEISRNTVERNGLVNNIPAGSGIGVQSLIQLPPETDMLVEANEVHGNARHGLDIQSRRNVIRGNNAAGNGANPSDFGGFDLRDANFNCDSNVWDGNIWGSAGFSPACTTTGGHAASLSAPLVAGSSADLVGPLAPTPRPHPARPR